MIYAKIVLIAFAVLAPESCHGAALPVTDPPPAGAVSTEVARDATAAVGRKLQSTPPNAASVTSSQIPPSIKDDIQSYCQNQVCNGEGLEWKLLGDSGVDINSPAPSYVQAFPDQISWSGLDRPIITETQVQYECASSASGTATCTAELTVTHGTSIEHSTSQTSKVGVSFSVEASIPEVMKMSASTSLSLSTTTTESQTTSDSETTSLEVAVPIEEGQKKCVSVVQKQSTFQSTWTLPMALTNPNGDGIRCDYSSPCLDHYYWFGSFERMSPADTSYTISGKATANVMSYGAVHIRPGACSEASPPPPPSLPAPPVGPCPDCNGKIDTWDEEWGSSPQDRCSVWVTNSEWGALSDGKTVAESCSSDFGDKWCAATCCLAVGGKTDTFKESWGSSPQARCSTWSTNSDWGALAGGNTLLQSCVGWGSTWCAATCCALAA